MILSSNKGWIKIAEAFIAILLLTGIILIAINSIEKKGTNISSKVYNTEIFILRNIQLNNTLRERVLSTNGIIGWEDIGFPTEIKTKIEEKTPPYLECVANICSPSDLCLLSETQKKDVYSESALITSTKQTYNPRLIKLFCWEK